MKVSLATVFVQVLSFLVSTGEALGQLTETRLGGQELGAVVDAVNDAIQQTTRYSGLQDAVDNRGKNTGTTGSNGGRRHHNSHGTRRQHGDCNNNDIAECVELLEVLTNKDLGFAATVDELNKMCPVLLDGLQCIDNYTRRCLTQKHRDYFNKLYAGTIRVIKDLCNTRGRYQEEYIRHAPCMRQVNPKYNVCSVTYHRKTVTLNHMQDAAVTLSEDEKNRNVIILCCSFQEYLQCSERVVFETCGNETALFTKEFLDRMAGPIVQGHGHCATILNLYPCPRDLFPTDLEGLPSPDSFTTDPSSPPAPPPTSTTWKSSGTTTPEHEAATGGEHPQRSVTDSFPAPSPQPQPSRTMVFTHETTQRPITHSPATPFQEEAQSSDVDDSSLSGDADVVAETPGTSDGDLSSTVRLRVAHRQPQLDLEAMSLHELECVTTEGQQSSESPREHGHRDAPAESASLPSLLVASSLLEPVILPPTRSKEHDSTSINGLTNISPSSENLDANPQSALYSSDSNTSLAYSHPHSRRSRLPADKAPRRPPRRSRRGQSRMRSRSVSHGGVADPRRPVPIEGVSQMSGLQPTKTPMHPSHIRHSRRYLRLPLRRRGGFRRRKPLLSRTSPGAGQGKLGTTNSSSFETRPKLPMQRRRLRGYRRLNGTTQSPRPDEEQEANTDADFLEVTRAKDNMTGSSAVSSERLQPSRPSMTSPEGAKEASPLAIVPQPAVEVGNDRARYPIKSQRHPQRRHRRPGRRRKYYRGKGPHLPGKRVGVRRRPGWRRVKQPSGTTGSRPTPLTPSFPPGVTFSQGDNVKNDNDLNAHPPVSDQNIRLKADVAGGDTTLVPPLLSTSTESETQVMGPSAQQPTSTSTPTPLTSVESLETLDPLDEVRTTMSSVDPVLLTQDLPNLNTQKEGWGTSTFLEIPTGVHDHVDETWATDPSVSPVLQVGHSQDLDLATQIEGRSASTLLEVSTEEKNNVDEIQGLPYHATNEGRGASIPLHGAHDTDGTTTKQTRSTTTISITRESLLSMTPSPTTEDSTSISNPGIDRTQFDDVDTETDVQNISPTDPSTGGSYLSPDASDLWLQNLFLSEVREAVFPAPTPIPFTVKFWQEHDRRMDTKGFFSNFVPLTVDVLESDFVPLMHPAATDTNRNSVSDMFENEKSDDSDIGLSKSINEDLPEETILEEEVTSVDGVPRSQQQHPSTTAAAGSEDGPSNPTEGLAPDSVLSQSSTAGGAASDSGDSVEEDTRSLPTVADIEFHPGNGTINEKEEEKEREKKKRKKKRKKIKKDKEEETIAEDQSDRDKKPNTSRPRLSVTPNDLRDYNRTSPARVQDVRNVSSSGLPINTQFTLSPTPSSSVSPSISGATNYNPSLPWQRTDGEHRTHVPPSQDTSSPTQSSLDKLVSHDEDQSRHQSPKNETGAPDRPTPADDTRSTLREEESGGANGARMPRVHAAVAVAVLMTLL